MATEIPRIVTMWGSNPFVRSDNLDSVSTVGELTYRYAHGEFEAEQYQHLLDGVVQKIVKDETATHHNNAVKIRRACMLQINKRHYGKTPLEMLISFESFYRLAYQETPDAAYRLSLKRTFEGIFALHQAAGRYIDIDYTNSPLRERYGTPDLEINIAGLCAFFPLDVYGQTVTAGGSIEFKIIPRGTFVPREPEAALTTSILFDFIKFLWPNVPTSPEMDPPSFNRFEGVLQDRQNKSVDKVLEMFNVSKLDNGTTRMSFDPAWVCEDDAPVLDVGECITHMMALRKYQVPLTDKDTSAIAAADAVAIPIVTEWMNRARITGAHSWYSHTR